ncbi:MAG: trigger factor [Phototrophicales bacterium]
MKFQTEHLDNHTARFTVELDAERFENAKQKAARKIAKQVNIRGFRKGKVPYSVLVRNGFESYIINEAIEDLTQVVYREALEQSGVEPYGPGNFDDIQFDEEAAAPTFIYSVPLKPVVKLGDYRAIRKEFSVPEVTDEMLEKALEDLRKRHAVVDVKEGAAEAGDQVELDVHATFADDPPQLTEADADEGTDKQPEKGAPFMHEHGFVCDIDLDDDPVMPGFLEQIIGAKAEDELDFELTVPDDDQYSDIAGRKIAFNIIVNQVKTVTLPELDDDFAQRVSADDPDGPFSLEQLREKIRETLQKELESRANEEYLNNVMDEIVSISEFTYPEAMVDDFIDDLVKELEERLKQQGISLEQFLNIMQKTNEELRADYREAAEVNIKRSLALGEILLQEHVSVPEEDIDAQIDEMVVQFGEQAETIRQIFDTPRMRSNIRQNLLQKALYDRIIAIAKGEEIPAPKAEESQEDVQSEAEVSLQETPAETEIEASDQEQE